MKKAVTYGLFGLGASGDCAGLATAIAATLGAATADATVFTATLDGVASYSGNGSSPGNISSSTATWSYDDVTGLLSQTGGTFNVRFTITPTTTLFRHLITGLVIGDGAAAAASTYACSEGNFGGNVGASLCGNYNFGANFANDSTVSWGPGTATARTIGGDDMALGPQQQIANYDNFTTLSWNGTSLTLSNASCNPFAPGNASGCATTGGSNTGYTWTLTATPPSPPVANPDTASTRFNQFVDIDVLGNDTNLTDPVEVSISSPADNGGIASIRKAGADCADPCSGNAADIVVRLTPNATEGTATYVENFQYTVSGSAAANVAVTVNNEVPVANDTTLTIDTQGVAPAAAAASFNAGTLAGNNLGDAPSTVDTGNESLLGTDSASGSTVTYTPAANSFTGSDSFTYTITDADGESDSGTVTVNIPNVVPVLDDTSDTVANDEIATGDLLTLTTPGNGSPAQHTFALDTDATNGSCDVTGSTLTYTPNDGYVGADSCVVSITDGDGDSDTATISIDVVEPTAPPPSGGGGDSGLREDDGGSSADWLLLSLLGSGALLGRRRRRRA